MSTFTTNISIGDIPVTTADYLESATLVALLKKNEEEIQTLRELMVSDFILPVKPLAMACVFVKLAGTCVMAGIKDDIAEVTGSGQIEVGCIRGCEFLHWALQVAMEADPSLRHAVVDTINGFNEM
jgi:hypothetical protein